MSLLLLEDESGEFRALLEDDGFLVLEGHLQIEPAVETDAAQVLTFTKTIRVTVTPAEETDTAQAFFWQSGAARRLIVHKAPAWQPANETDEAQVLVITHVQSRTLTPVNETDAAQALSLRTGAVQYRTITPVIESG